MAKTFDNISEASATNYLFLFAQRTLALQNEPPTPPPLNALGLPYHSCRALRLVPKPRIQPEASLDSFEQKKATDEPRSSTAEDGHGEETEKNFAQKIAPLAEKITEYISAHQDHAAQEDRWRTTIKRETMKRFREINSRLSRMDEKMDRLSRMDEKMDQLIKSITQEKSGRAD